MKRYTAVLLVSVMSLLITGAARSQGWGLIWNNNANPGVLPFPGTYQGINDWQLDSRDSYLPGCYYNGSNWSGLLIVNYATGLTASLEYSQSTWTPSSDNVYSPPAPGFIGYEGADLAVWWMHQDDIYKLEFFQGDGKQYFMGIRPSTGWAMLLQNIDGSGNWENGTLNGEYVWQNNGNGTIGPWTIDGTQRFVPGRLDPNLPDQDVLLAVDPGKVPSAKLLEYSTSAKNWVSDPNWSSSNNTIGDWTMASTDLYAHIDFNGDGNEEVLFVSPSTGNAMIQQFSGSGWIDLWKNNGSGYIGPWGIDPTGADVYTALHMDGGTPTDVLCINHNSGNAEAIDFTFTTGVAGSGQWSSTAKYSNNRSNHLGDGSNNVWTISPNDVYIRYTIGNSPNQQLVCINRSTEAASLLQFSDAPQISSLTPSPNPIWSGQASVVTCNASSPGGLGLSYSWSNNGNGVNYTAVPNGNIYTITDEVLATLVINVTVIVTDAYGGTATATTSVTLNPGTEGGGGGGGGCPYVYTANAGTLTPENNILPQSEYPGNAGKQVVDYYPLMNPPLEQSSRYVLKLGEFEHERSAIDQVKLIAVDHPKGTNITVTPDGKIVQYINPFMLQPGLTDLQGNNLPLKLGALDGITVNVTKGDTKQLKFTPNPSQAADNVSGFTQAGILLGGAVNNDVKMGIARKAPPPSAYVGGGSFINSKPLNFAFREQSGVFYAPLDNLNQSVSVTFADDIRFDYAALVVEVPDSYAKHELLPTSAMHSRLGDVTLDLNADNEDAVTMDPGEQITLSFDKPHLAPEMDRSFILVTNGRYEKISNTMDIKKMEKPTAFSLAQNYPNPFNPTTTIDYAIPSNVFVHLTVYNVLGQVVKTLVNQDQGEGYKSVTFDATNLPSGLYFYRLDAGSFTSMKKLLLVK